MKTRRISTSALCLLVVVFSIFCLFACKGDDDCSHEWGEWTPKTEATCTEEGTQVRKCNNCDEQEESTISALGHDYKEATCSEPKKCSRCSATEGSALAHIYDQETAKPEALKSGATCTSTAVYYKSCSCGAVSTNAADTFTSGTVTAHTYDQDTVKVEALKTAATCTAPAVYYKSCSCGLVSANLGETFTSGTVIAHNCTQELVKADALKSAATCTSAAVYYKSCACGHVSSSDEEIFRSGTTLSHTHSQDIVKTEALKSSASCTSPAVYYKSCSCGHVSTSDAETFTSGTATAHTHEQQVVKTETLKSSATCTSAAVYYKSCTCGHVSEDVEEVFFSGTTIPHTHIEASSTPATCTDPLSKTYRCSCGDEYSEDVGDALEHDITGATPEERLVSGCEYVRVYECQRGDCEEEVEGEHIFKHNHVSSITRAATCENDGEKKLLCSCGDTKTEPIEKNETGHAWVKGAESEGSRTDTCSHCGETKTVAVYSGTNTGAQKTDDLKNTEIELNGANIRLDDGVIDDAIGGENATVSAEKYEGDDRESIGIDPDDLLQVGDSPIYNFTIEGDAGLVSDFGEENFVTITLRYDLSPGEDVDSIAVWCIKADGELEGFPAVYNEVDGLGYVTFQTNHFSYYTVTKLNPEQRCAIYGHNYLTQTVEGSCTKDGYDLHVCVRCHDSYVDNLVIADGHSYGSDVHSATCTEDGYILYECADCDHSYTTKLKATGHSWSIEDEEESTCTSNGFTKYGCDNCDAEYTVAYEKAAHDYEGTTVPATCEEAGYTCYECEVCGHTYTDAFVAAIGHSYETSVWAWADDYSSAVVAFVCENDEEHTATLDANISKVIVNGICSEYEKTIYIAAVSYNGTIYSDEKIIEIGTLDHIFSDYLLHNATEHWNECVCGEKSNVTVHSFENATVTKEPTCSNSGESTAYCVCGETKSTVVPATGNHVYQNGSCVMCGAFAGGSDYYTNLLNSWKEIDGFAIRIEDFSLDVKEQDGFLEELKLIGRIQQIDIAELTLYLEDGKLGGAAKGSATIFNGPIANEDATFEFKAVINDGYVYISVNYGKSLFDNDIKIKVEVDALLEEFLYYELEVSKDGFTQLLSFMKDTVLPTLDTVIGIDYEEALLNIIFTFEKQANGSYIATLDSNKLAALNENLATKTIAEVIDIYFGEGTFDTLEELVLEIFDLELSEIPEYLEGRGIDTEDLASRINAYAALMGRSDFDILTILNDEELAGLTLGMLVFDYRDDTYVTKITDFTNELRELSLYQMLRIDEGIKGRIASIIGMVFPSCELSLVTDASGMLTAININANDFKLAVENETTVNFDIDIIINEKINVTWLDIIDEIESAIVPPEDAAQGEDVYISYNYESHVRGTVYYKGEVYDYFNGIGINVYKHRYDKPFYIMITSDCTGWKEYEAGYYLEYYYFMIATIEVEGAPVTLLIDFYNGTAVELVETDGGFKAIFEDGTEKTVEFSFDENISDIDDMLKAYADLYFAIFEDVKGMINYDGSYHHYYHNAESGEYADSSRHEHEYEYEVIGDYCGYDGCTVVVTCTKCDYYDTYTRYSCEYEYDVTIDLSEHSSCGGSIRFARCKICGHIYYVNSMDINCDMDEGVVEDILDAEGNVIGEKCTYTCTDCGLVFVMNEWFEYRTVCEYIRHNKSEIYIGDDCIFSYTERRSGDRHEYETTYEMLGDTCEDGYYIIEACHICGDSTRYHYRGHYTEYRDIDLSDRLCGGYIEEQYCTVCDTVIHSNIVAYNCYWRYIEENADGYSVYECNYCGAVRLQKTIISEKDEQCSYTRTESNIYTMDGEEIYRSDDVYYVTQHNYQYEFELNGESCEDGGLAIGTCEDCGYISRSSIYSHYNIFELEKADLAESGACYGTLTYYTCACGHNQDVQTNSICANVWSSNQYYDDYGRLVHVSTRTCSVCGLRYDSAYYTVRDRETCTAINYNTVTVSIDGNLVFMKEYITTSESHDYEIDAALKNGEGSSCEDGVVLTYTCKDCGDGYESETYWHVRFEIERIDLSELGCDCGGYASLEGCACGLNQSLYLDNALCDFGTSYCDIWIDNAITGGQYYINGWNSYYTNSYIYTCAVTHPESCAFKIRYASYWVKAEDECKAYYYQTWQFGYDAEADTYLYQLTIKGSNGNAYHNYTNGSTENCTKYDCADCGSYYYVNNYYDGSGRHVKTEELRCNTLNDGNNRYYEHITEYDWDASGNRYISREYSKTVYADGEEYWEEYLRTEEEYTGPFGENGRKGTDIRTYSNGASSSEEYAYVMYKGYRFDIYRCTNDGDSWERYDYTYTFDGECLRTTTYSNSLGESRTDTANICKLYFRFYSKDPTCTQDGEVYDYCVICGRHTNIAPVGPTDHNWVQVDDGLYCCTRCNMENANGASGSVVMEDLTAFYGRGENYVIGYYIRNNVEFTYYVSLIFSDETEFLLSGVDFIEINGIRAFAFSKAQVEALASENGYTDATAYDVRFTFVPYGSDSSFDYAVTFTDEETITVSTDETVTFEMPSYKKVNITVVPEESGTWTMYSSTDFDSYGILYDADGNQLSYDDDGRGNGDFIITYELTAGEIYILTVRAYSNGSFVGYQPVEVTFVSPTPVES